MNARRDSVTRTLKECGVLLTGGTPRRSEPKYWGGRVPWISAKSLKHFDVVDSEERLTDAGVGVATVVPPGSVLFVVRGMSLANELRVGVAVRDVAFNQDLRALVPGQELDGRYLARFLQAESRRILTLVDEASHGTKRLTSDRFEKIEVPVPPLATQRRIVRLLDLADKLRAKRRAALATLDTLTQAIFLDMFGDPATNPRAWREGQTLGKVADIVSGVTKGRSITGKVVRRVPYLAVSNVHDQKLELSVVKSIEATPDEIERFRLVRNDLLLTEGGDPDKLGRGTLWNSEIPECIHQNHIFRVRLTSNDLHPIFLSWLVASQRGKRYFLRSAKQTTGIASINMTQLSGFPLFFPPIALQIEFSGRLEKLSAVKTTFRASLTEFDHLFASLQHRAFRGEL